MSPYVRADQEKNAEFCRRHDIRRLSFFGSVLRDDFQPDSDIDVLVTFEPGLVVGLRIVEIEDELAKLLGRRVDLVGEKYLNRRIRDRVLSAAEVQYAEGSRCLRRPHAGHGARPESSWRRGLALNTMPISRCAWRWLTRADRRRGSASRLAGASEGSPGHPLAQHRGRAPQGRPQPADRVPRFPTFVLEWLLRFRRSCLLPETGNSRLRRDRS